MLISNSGNPGNHGAVAKALVFFSRKPCSAALVVQGETRTGKISAAFAVAADLACGMVKAIGSAVEL